MQTIYAQFLLNIVQKDVLRNVSSASIQSQSPETIKYIQSYVIITNKIKSCECYT